MHALATAKAGSLGDERYISHSIYPELISERLNRPKMAVFLPFVQRQSGEESLLRSYHSHWTPRACSSPNLSAIGRTSRVCQVVVINTQHTCGGGIRRVAPKKN